MMTLIFCVYFAAALSFGISEFVHEYYVITTRCNVTHDDVIATSRGTTHCGAACLSHADCSGFRYSPLEGSATGEGCHIYSNKQINGSDGCTMEDPGLTDIYVERDLATTLNMTWINQKNSTGPHGNNDTNNSNSTLGPSSCQNGAAYESLQGECVCVDGWIGPTCENLSQDCSALQATGLYPHHGIYFIHPPTAPAAFQAYCFITAGYGLTQIQAHVSAAPSFNRSWDDYKNGFSYDATWTNFWIGNENIHYLTTSRSQRLLVDIKNGSISYQFHHYNFVMASEDQNYSVTYDSFSSFPDTSMTPCWPQGPALPFSTYDRDNDGDPVENCAALHGAGWWFESENCTRCNVNGLIDSAQHIREGNPEEAFVLPIDSSFLPEYTLMGLYVPP